MRICKRRLGLLVALAAGLAPLVLTRAADIDKNTYYRGKVVSLADAVAKHGIKLDADAPAMLALVAEDGKILPILKDAGARMFYQDVRLRNRPMRLTGRLVPGSNLLQVINVHSEKQGKLHDVYYWCDICTIRNYQLVICDCCGGPMELREVPVAGK